MNELWKAVKGYEGLYEVSNTGKVRSIDRTIIGKDGKAKKIKGKELFFTVSKLDEKAHLPRASVQLWKNNNSKLVLVHRLVALAFIPNPQNKETVNHIDGNPLNNNVGNLEWATYSENNLHAYKIGLHSPSRNMNPSNSRKVLAYNPETGEEIERDSCAQLARELGVCHQIISTTAKKNEDVEIFKVKGYIVQYL